MLVYYNYFKSLSTIYLSSHKIIQNNIETLVINFNHVRVPSSTIEKTALAPR